MASDAAGKFVIDLDKWRADQLQRPRSILTPHETRIVEMLATGASYKAIAGQLGVTVNTIRNYIRSIYAKLGVHTKSEAVSKALRARIIT